MALDSGSGRAALAGVVSSPLVTQASATTRNNVTGRSSGSVRYALDIERFMESFAAPAAPLTARAPLAHGFELDSTSSFTPGSRVRVTHGHLAGLTGWLVASDDSSRWLIQMEASDGAFLRIASQALEVV